LPLPFDYVKEFVRQHPAQCPAEQQFREAALADRWTAASVERTSSQPASLKAINIEPLVKKRSNS
jgi:hypothetical protein